VTLPIWTNNPNTPLSATEIQTEFGGTAPTNMSEYFRNGSSGYVTNDRVGFPNGVSTPIPLFGSPLSISNFYGASSVSYSITTNKTAYNEGETMSISVTAPATDGTTLYWTIEDSTTGINISPTTLPNGIKGGYVNEAYQPVQLTASGGTAPYTFSVVVGSTPAGITLSSSGSLSGFPTSAGVTTFTVQAIDSQGNGGIRQYSLAVANVTYLPATLPAGTQNALYSQQLSVSGGTAPYVYEVLGTLPAGLSLSSSGLISGTPTTSGTFNTSIRVSFNGGSMGDPGITIFYQDWIISGPVSISVSPSTLPTATINLSYSQQLTASGGTSPYTYSTSSSLPNGVTLSSGGLLSGTPTQSGTYNLTIQVTDNASRSTNVQRALSVGSVNIGISPLSSNVLTGTQNSSFSQQFTASGGTAPYTYSAIGQLPPGLSLTNGGLLAGTPTSSGTFGFTISALDANSNSGTATYSLAVSAPATPDYEMNSANGMAFTLGNPPRINNNTVPQSAILLIDIRPDFDNSGVTPYDVTVNFELTGDIVVSDIISMTHSPAIGPTTTITPSLTGTLTATYWTLNQSFVRLEFVVIRKPSMPFRDITMTVTGQTVYSGSPVVFTDTLTLRDDSWL